MRFRHSCLLTYDLTSPARSRREYFRRVSVGLCRMAGVSALAGRGKFLGVTRVCAWINLAGHSADRSFGAGVPGGQFAAFGGRHRLGPRSENRSSARWMVRSRPGIDLFSQASDQVHEAAVDAAISTAASSPLSGGWFDSGRRIGFARATCCASAIRIDRYDAEE